MLLFEVFNCKRREGIDLGRAADQVGDFGVVVVIHEGHVADVKDCREQLKETLNVLRGQVHDSQGELEGLKVLLVINGSDLDATGLVEVLELLWGGKLEPDIERKKSH